MLTRFFLPMLICVSFSSKAFSQKQIKLKEIKDLMESSRVAGPLPCMAVLKGGDTVWGKKIDWKWNKKLDAGEWHVDDQEYHEDSVVLYQDKDGLYTYLTFIFSSEGKVKERYKTKMARIMKGKIDLYVTNFDTRGKGSAYNPVVINSSRQRSGLDPNRPTGYIQGTSVRVTSQYYVRQDGRLEFLTYGKLKEIIAGHPEALKTYKTEFSSPEHPDKSITDWDALKKVLEVYNQ